MPSKTKSPVPAAPKAEILPQPQIVITDFVKTHPARELIEDAIYLEMSGEVETITMSIDFGQGRTKAARVIKNQEGDFEHIKHSCPSMISRQKGENNDALRKAISASRVRTRSAVKEKKEPTSFYLTYKKSHYVLGDDAIDDGSSSLNDRMRYLSEGFKVALMSMGSWMMDKTMPGKKEAIIYVVTHVPMDLLSSKVNGISFADALMKEHSGEYHFTRHTPEGDTDFTITAIILECLGEGTGAAIHAGPEGNGTYFVGDLGRGTSDFIPYSGIEPMVKECFNENIGVSTIEERFNEFVYDQYDRNLTSKELFACLQGYKDMVVAYGDAIDEETLNVESKTSAFEQDKARAYRAEITRHMPVAHYLDEKTEQRIPIDAVNLYLLLRKASTEIGNNVSSIIRSRYGKDSQGVVGKNFAALIFVGGMIYFVSHVLREKFKGITLEREPEFTNALGLASRAFSDYIFDILGKGEF